jgi:hypothetical protein
MLPKCRQHGFDIPPYSWTGIQGSSNFVQGPPRTSARPTHVSTCVQEVLNTTNLLKICGHLSSMFLSKGLTCYTDVESNGRDLANQPAAKCATYRQEDTHARADTISLQAPCSQSVSTRFDIHPYRLDNSHQRIVELRTGPSQDGATHTRFQRA